MKRLIQSVGSWVILIGITALFATLAVQSPWLPGETSVDTDDSDFPELVLRPGQHMEAKAADGTILIIRYAAASETLRQHP